MPDLPTRLPIATVVSQLVVGAALAARRRAATASLSASGMMEASPSPTL